MRALEQAADRTRLVINPIVYAEISVRFSRIEELEAALPKDMIEREAIPFEASVPGRQGIPAVLD